MGKFVISMKMVEGGVVVERKVEAPKEWGKTTHEVAKHVYDLLNVGNEHSAILIGDLLVTKRRLTTYQVKKVLW